MLRSPFWPSWLRLLNALEMTFTLRDNLTAAIARSGVLVSHRVASNVLTAIHASTAQNSIDAAIVTAI